MEEQYLAVRDALAANLRLQERLREALDSVEKGITNNADMQAKVQMASMRVNRAGWYQGLKAIDFPSIGKVGPRAVGPSRFWVAAGSVPEPNQDTRKLLEAYRYLPHTLAIRKWAPEEEAQLNQAVMRHLQETRHETFMLEVIQDNLQLSETELEAKMQEISELTIKSPGAEEDVMAFDLRRWELIAMQLPSNHSAAECMSHWNNSLRPSLAGNVDAPWTTEEDAQLAELAELHGGCNWPTIAEELGTGRSAAACLRRVRQAQQPAAAKRWTEEEIAQLRVSCSKHAGKGSFWKAVAADLPGRTPAQCMHYWRNNMDKSIRKGKWAPEEDEQLTTAVKLFGKKWARVAEAVPTRNQVQCRERWVNMLDPSLKKGLPWTPEEEKILVDGMRECKNEDGSIRWSEIAERLPGRTDDAVSNHAIALRNYVKKVAPRSSKGRGRSGRAGRGRKRKLSDSESPEPELSPVRVRGGAGEGMSLRKRPKKKVWAE